MNQLDLDEFPDPTDWKGPYSFMKDFDQAFICEICSDILTAPVSIKACSHTFCSECIRRHLNQSLDSDKKTCPKCNKSGVHDSSLIPQHGFALAAENWKRTRASLIAKQKAEFLSKKEGKRRAIDDEEERFSESRPVATSSKSKDRSPSLNGHRSTNESSRPTRAAKETKKVNYNYSQNIDGDDEESALKDEVLSQDVEEIDSRPSKKRRTNSGGSGDNNQNAIVIDDSDDEDYDPSENKTSNARPSNSPMNGKSSHNDFNQASSSKLPQVFECPICQWTFTEIALDGHFTSDGCKFDGKPEPTEFQRGLTKSSGPSFASTKGRIQLGDSKISSSSKRQDNYEEEEDQKLRRPNYNLMKEPELKQLLKETGLSDKIEGRALDKASRVKKLENRHRKFVDLYNSNLDAPRAHREGKNALLNKLREWERSEELKKDPNGSGLSKAERENLKEHKQAEKAKGMSGKAWEKKQEGNFAVLIRQIKEAQEKKKIATAQAVEEENQVDGKDSDSEDPIPTSNPDASSSGSSNPSLNLITDTHQELEEQRNLEEDQMQVDRESRNNSRDRSEEDEVEAAEIPSLPKGFENGQLGVNGIDQDLENVEEDAEPLQDFPPSSQNTKSISTY